jgi:HSP20 family protein
MALPSLFRVQREAPVARFAPHPGLPLLDEVNRLFEDFFRDVPAAAGWPGVAAGFAPSLEIEETDDAVRIAAELPGIEEKDVELTLEDGVLTLKGEKRSESATEHGRARRSERSFGRFERSIRLPCEVVEDKASAEFKNGVLNVTLPKAPAAKSRTISIPVKSA